MLQNRVYRYGMMLVAATCVVVGIAFLLKSTSASKNTRHREVNNAWGTSLDDIIRVGGPVLTMTLEGTDISTDQARSTLRQYPLMKFHYDESCRVIKREDLSEDGVPLSASDYEYDREGRLAKEVHRNIYQVKTSETLYKYDSRERPAEQVQIDADDGTVLTKRTFTYAGDNAITKINAYKGEKLQASAEVFRNSHGQIVEIRLTSYELNGNVNHARSIKSILTYDNRGNKMTESSYDGKGELVEEAAYSYEYDAHNNWVKKLKDIKRYEPDGNSSLTREVFHRNITYR